MINPERITLILVDPEKPRNIGFVARAMKCNALMDLRIVSSHWTRVHSAAYITGTSAKEQLENAKFYASLKDALADVHYSVGFSRRNFNNAASECWLNEVHDHFPQEGKIALVFGRESQGLTEDELGMCNMLCAIPAAGTLSYNLGQAVSVALYEVSAKAEMAGKQNFGKPAELANGQQKQALIGFILKHVGKRYTGAEGREPAVRAILERMVPTTAEVRLIFGLLREMAGLRRVNGSKEEANKVRIAKEKEMNEK